MATAHSVTTPASGLDLITRLSSGLAERANPLTVRLVRQHLRSPSFLLLFGLQVLLGLIASVVIAGTEVNLLLSGGRLLFVVLVSAWILTAWVLAPILLTNAIRSERQETTWALLDLTGMRPLTILNGYLGAAAIQQVLLLAAMAPFLILSWLLRGLDPALLAAAFICVPVGGLFTLAAGLQAACSPRKKTGQNAAISLGIGGVLGWLFMSNALFWIMFTGNETRVIEGLWRGEPELWLGTLLIANIVVLGFLATLVTTAMNLTHPAEDRAFVPRLLAWVLVLNALAWVVLAEFVGAKSAGVLTYVGTVVVGRTVVLGLVAISENYSRTPRQHASWKDIHGWRRSMAWALAPGAASGRRCYLVLLTLGTVAVIAAFPWSDAHRHVEVTTGALGTACYATWFLVLGDVLFRRFFSRRRHQPHLQRVWTVTLAVVAMVIGWLSYIVMLDHLPILAPIDVVGGMKSIFSVLNSPDSSTLETHLPSALIVLLFGLGSAIVLARQSRRPVTIERLRPEDD